MHINQIQKIFFKDKSRGSHHLVKNDRFLHCRFSLSLAMRGLSENLQCKKRSFLTKWWDPLDLPQKKSFGSGLYAPWRGLYCYGLIFFCKVSFQKHPIAHSYPPFLPSTKAPSSFSKCTFYVTCCISSLHLFPSPPLPPLPSFTGSTIFTSSHCKQVMLGFVSTSLAHSCTLSPLSG